jgi:PLD-like domain
MRLLINTTKLEAEFIRLTNQYENLYWATAWAGVGSKHFECLLDNKEKIRKIIVGVHFYQTHPDFIKTFIDSKNLHFVNQPQGTFHPKLYLFHNTDTDWEIIIGSSNFTYEAFNGNTEANTLVSSKDVNSEEFLKYAFELIDESWKISKSFTQSDFLSYKTIWKNQRPKVKSLSGLYGSDKSDGKPIYEVPVINMKWKDFVSKIRNEDSHGLDRRLKVIDIAQKLFRSVEHFNELDNDKRKFIAGVTTQYAVDWGFFGSMIGRGDYVHEIIVNNKNISIALDQIPLNGQITKTHYDNFIKHFTKVFSGNYIGVASRLLAMKRPDVFYCLTAKNQKGFCKDFNVKKSEIDYKGYWEHVIERIYDSEWWLNPTCSTIQEQKISNARAAFLDAIYFEE